VNTWGWISLVVLAAPLVALDRWIARDRRRNRGREHIIRRYGPHPGDHHQTDADAPTEILPPVRPAPPDALQVGHFSGVLPLPERPHRNIPRPTPYRRRALHTPDPEVMQRVLKGLRNLT
jgi:hypothetical protein